MKRRNFVRGLAAMTACACPVCNALVSGPAAASEDHGQLPHWSYEGIGGPRDWGELLPEYRACSTGREQSPINLVRSIPAMLGEPVLAWNSTRLTVVNNGHTIQVDCDPGSSVTLDGTKYDLIQFHFHHPSEHQIDGISYDMEVHFVHKAADGNLAVLGVMIQKGPANPTLETIWRAMPKNGGEKVTLETRIMPATLVTEDATTFRYAGSLTTPPCSEVVSWVVYRQPISASTEQIATFAALFPMNARPVQPLNRRKLLLDFF